MADGAASRRPTLVVDDRGVALRRSCSSTPPALVEGRNPDDEQLPWMVGSGVKDGENPGRLPRSEISVMAVEGLPDGTDYSGVPLAGRANKDVRTR